tara:strand:- start:536 stop:1027 length:492 start_codon:yes stop_codon:yes gene_type:complete
VHLEVSIADQALRLVQENGGFVSFPVSTGKNGVGEQMNTGCTPRGWHRVKIVIGRDQPLHAVFRGRRPTGEICTPELVTAFPQRDWVLTRILWLDGIEPGKNRGGEVDSLRRYIYIHGTPDSEPMGVPLSHGCIRMRNADVAELAELVPAGTRVLIQEAAFSS